MENKKIKFSLLFALFFCVSISNAGSTFDRAANTGITSWFNGIFQNLGKNIKNIATISSNSFKSSLGQNSNSSFNNWKVWLGAGACVIALRVIAYFVCDGNKLVKKYQKYFDFNKMVKEKRAESKRRKEENMAESKRKKEEETAQSKRRKEEETAEVGRLQENENFDKKRRISIEKINDIIDGNHCIKRGKINFLKSKDVFNKLSNINEEYCYGFAPIHLAVKYDSVELFKWLIDEKHAIVDNELEFEEEYQQYDGIFSSSKLVCRKQKVKINFFKIAIGNKSFNVLKCLIDEYDTENNYLKEIVERIEELSLVCPSWTPAYYDKPLEEENEFIYHLSDKVLKSGDADLFKSLVEKVNPEAFFLAIKDSKDKENKVFEHFLSHLSDFSKDKVEKILGHCVRHNFCIKELIVKIANENYLDCMMECACENFNKEAIELLKSKSKINVKKIAQGCSSEKINDIFTYLSDKLIVDELTPEIYLNKDLNMELILAMLEIIKIDKNKFELLSGLFAYKCAPKDEFILKIIQMAQGKKDLKNIVMVLEAWINSKVEKNCIEYLLEKQDKDLFLLLFDDLAITNNKFLNTVLSCCLNDEKIITTELLNEQDFLRKRELERKLKSIRDAIVKNGWLHDKMIQPLDNWEFSQDGSDKDKVELDKTFIKACVEFQIFDIDFAKKIIKKIENNHELFKDLLNLYHSKLYFHYVYDEKLKEKIPELIKKWAELLSDLLKNWEFLPGDSESKAELNETFISEIISCIDNRDISIMLCDKIGHDKRYLDFAMNKSAYVWLNFNMTSCLIKSKNFKIKLFDLFNIRDYKIKDRSNKHYLIIRYLIENKIFCVDDSFDCPHHGFVNTKLSLFLLDKNHHAKIIYFTVMNDGGNMPLLKYLVEKGVKINDEEFDLLDLAFSTYNAEMIIYLVNNGVAVKEDKAYCPAKMMAKMNPNKHGMDYCEEFPANEYVHRADAKRKKLEEKVCSLIYDFEDIEVGKVVDVSQKIQEIKDLYKDEETPLYAKKACYEVLSHLSKEKPKLLTPEDIEYFKNKKDYSELLVCSDNKHLVKAFIGTDLLRNKADLLIVPKGLPVKERSLILEEEPADKYFSEVMTSLSVGEQKINKSRVRNIVNLSYMLRRLRNNTMKNNTKDLPLDTALEILNFHGADFGDKLLFLTKEELDAQEIARKLIN